MKRLLMTYIVIVVTGFMRAQSSIDTLIAVNEQIDPNIFTLIISNENYKYEQSVPYALNDGNIFALYCEKTLGVPQKNIKIIRDATKNDMLIKLAWLQEVMKTYEGDARAIIYYSGHGMPSEDGQHAYLLPVDGVSNISSSGVSTEEVYKMLGEMPSKETIVFLDACFSGASRSGDMLTSARAVAIETKNHPITGNMVVFSACKGNETAYPYKEKEHGLFTYFLLKQLQEKGGNVTMGELSDYVRKSVSRASIVENDKSQTPTVVSSTTVDGEWRNWRLAEKKATKMITVRPQKHLNVVPSPKEKEPSIPVPKPIPESAIAEYKVNNVVFNMILVKGGTFKMGATGEQKEMADDKETPVHQVSLDDYYIGETEVTQELWEAVMGRNPSKFVGKHKPVECVSWKSCQDFIDRLNELTGEKFRLPTEAEWEYAARGGNKPKGSVYAGSNQINEVACYADNSEERSKEVKSHKANEIGLYDMSGNLWEWCADSYKPYTDTPQTNPKFSSSSSDRVIRGGSWFSMPSDCRVSFRNAEPSTYRSSNVGLRIAK